ncbi:MAG TPA: metallophosphoesterase [Kofleriaceae bacterium]|nr:metallophosphoesterase [Kofleriaceae bacterium]
MTRTFAIGDPQGPFAKVLEVLDRHGLLAGDRLAGDVVLVSIGDHFDYDHRDPAGCAREGLALLRWLASHDYDQVKLLIGNHDAARVMELASISDADFAIARTCDPATYAARFPHLPPQHVLARDYAAFTVEQRELVQELVDDGTMRLALRAQLLDGRDCLLTHAGITRRELALLDLDFDPPPDPEIMATILQGKLAEATSAAVSAWDRGQLAPLSLAPLHVPGGDGKEGGGLLYHRPSNPVTGSLFDPERPRRFDPRTLPRGLVQVAGHSGHAKCVHELGAWCTFAARARAHGGIRSIAVHGDDVVYDLGTAGDFILIDSELRRIPAAEVELLPLAQLYL